MPTHNRRRGAEKQTSEEKSRRPQRVPRSKKQKKTYKRESQ